MRDFFARQEDARRQSGRLLLFFGMAVIGVALAVYVVTALLLLVGADAGESARFWRPQLFLWTTTATLLLIGACSWWKISELRDGGAGIATMLGARPVPLQPRDPRERMLRNVVEEMAIASGMPVPELFLLERERGINAFAAGNGIADSVICVTNGAVQLLTREELQGVVAHEFSHILNGDVLLNIRLLGWLNGILVVSQAGEIMLRGLRGGRGRSGGLIALVAVALYAIGYIGYFFGQLIKSAVSRQREYLGDASAVQFTRNPEGLAGALKKTGGLSFGSRLDHPRAAEISHMFFGNGVQEAWLHALDSHPPLIDRIRRLDPRFNGIYPRVEPLPPPPDESKAVHSRRVSPPQKVSPSLSGAGVLALLDSIGTPMQEHIGRARTIIAQLPDELMAAVRDPGGASLVVYALLLDKNPEMRERQERLVPMRQQEIVRLRGLAALTDRLPREARLPLLDLSLPALRTLDPNGYRQLKETVEALTAADGRVSLFEFALRYILLRHLAPRFNPGQQRPTQIYAVRGVAQECLCVLAAMARVGHGKPEEVQKSFEQGITVLEESQAERSLPPAAECDAAALVRAFDKLVGASLQIKRRLLAACLQCILHDGIVQGEEVELFRAVADAIGCPVPPWLDFAPTASSAVTTAVS